ncbi:transcriptional regulator [Streptomyces buecherae]|uniref:transcriptional regulator n=1 Tax=Streptomyces buecherae TaxID=2763006 RepID=UPI00379DC4B1
MGDLVELGRVHVDSSRRRVVGVGLFSVALAIPGWSDVVGRAQALQADPLARIGQAEVDSVIAVTDWLSEIDHTFGGHHARPMANAFLTETVAPYLRATAPEPVRKSMLTAAAMACYLTGWMAMDEGLHGIAQRYHLEGLELAGAADNRTTYGHILRGMSVHAAQVGHGPAATQYANAAADSIPSPGPRMKAFVAGQQAHGYALVISSRSALRSLRETERSLDKVTSGPGNTFGGFSYATLAYATAQVRYALGDVKGSVESLEEHFKLRDKTDSRRSGMIFGGLMAERQLELGHLDAACATWGRIFTKYPATYSDRAAERVRVAKRLLTPHLAHPQARQTHERARALLAQKSTARPSV